MSALAAGYSAFGPADGIVAIALLAMLAAVVGWCFALFFGTRAIVRAVRGRRRRREFHATYPGPIPFQQAARRVEVEQEADR